MAICAGALRRYLLEKHGLPKEPLVAMVPVSLREAGNTEIKNQVSGMLCSLATDIADPLERLKAIHASSVEAKEFSGKIKDVTPRDFSIFGAPIVLQGAMGLYGRSGLADRLPPSANVVISNVPGPQTPLYLAGARLLTLYPVSIPTHGMALNLTVQSYCGALDFGLTACRRTVPELRKLADYLEESLRRAARGGDRRDAHRCRGRLGPAARRARSGRRPKAASCGGAPAPRPRTPRDARPSRVRRSAAPEPADAVATSAQDCRVCIDCRPGIAFPSHPTRRRRPW